MGIIFQKWQDRLQLLHELSIFFVTNTWHYSVPFLSTCSVPVSSRKPQIPAKGECVDAEKAGEQT